MFTTHESLKDFKKCTSIIFNIPCKVFGALQVVFASSNKFPLPLEYLAIKSNKTKVVFFCQIIQDMD